LLFNVSAGLFPSLFSRGGFVHQGNVLYVLVSLYFALSPYSVILVGTSLDSIGFFGSVLRFPCTRIPFFFFYGTGWLALPWRMRSPTPPGSYGLCCLTSFGVLGFLSRAAKFISVFSVGFCWLFRADLFLLCCVFLLQLMHINRFLAFYT